jgi:lipid-A-disaccharide synthase
VDRLLAQRPPDAVVLIDYVGANARLGTRLRKYRSSLPITYYIAPQEWAWRFGDGSTTQLLGFTNQILAIFPAEAEFYAERGANVTWVGHPLLDSFQDLPERLASRRALGLDHGRRNCAI